MGADVGPIISQNNKVITIISPTKRVLLAKRHRQGPLRLPEEVGTAPRSEGGRVSRWGGREEFWAGATAVPTNALGRKVESTDEELEAACMAGMEGAEQEEAEPSYPSLFNLKVMGNQEPLPSF